MAIKLIVCSIIIILSAISGKLLKIPFENRVECLQSLSVTFNILESEMKYRMDPLEATFTRIAHLSDNYTQKFFTEISTLLTEKNFESFTDLWNKALNKVFSKSSLTEKDINVLKEVGLDLGKTDIMGQENIFRRINLQLEDQIAEAKIFVSTKGKMYQSLSLAIGFLIVIIFI